jgi:two-component system sensor histidine kinase BaeS
MSSRSSGAFNEMAASLQRAEEIRRELLADVAHELRTPLATVESYLEAMSDGVLPADSENWGAIRDQRRPQPPCR